MDHTAVVNTLENEWGTWKQLLPIHFMLDLSGRDKRRAGVGQVKRDDKKGMDIKLHPRQHLDESPMKLAVQYLGITCIKSACYALIIIDS